MAYTKKYTRNVTREYALGGFLKKALPIAGMAASLIPGVGPLAAGAIQLGTQAISSNIGGEQPRMSYADVNRAPKTYRAASHGYKYGGKLHQNGGALPMGNGALKYVGPAHEQGGIAVDQEGNPTNGANAVAEVEGGETEQDDYIFSDSLTVPNTGFTFAKMHERLVKAGADKARIEELKAAQERVKGKNAVASPRSSQMPANSPTTTSEMRAQPAQSSSDMRYKYVYGGDLDKKYVYGGNLYKARNGVDLDAARKDHSVVNPGRTTLGVRPPSPSPSNIGGMTVGNTPGSLNDVATGGGSGFDWGKALDIASYVVPSATRAGLALGAPKPEKAPRMTAETLPVTSPTSVQERRKLTSGYKTALKGSNSVAGRQAAHSAYLSGISESYANQRDYENRQQMANRDSRMQTQQYNVGAAERDIERTAQDRAMRYSLLTDAVQMPITQARADKANKQQTVAQIVAANAQISNTKDRQRAIRSSLLAAGFSEQEVQEILTTTEA